ncbi:hypothetical protein C804_05019, partial [Lachnospiraceae bacterium A4]
WIYPFLVWQLIGYHKTIWKGYFFIDNLQLTSIIVKYYIVFFVFYDKLNL